MAIKKLTGKKLPQRTDSHILEGLSNRFFQNNLPKNWTISKPENDYGVDFVVNIFDGHNASPYQLNIQLKSSQKATKAEAEHVKVTLKVSTYNHLKHQLHVGMLVKFIAEENEAYWILLVDIGTPNQHRETFSIKIPRNNRLSSINWKEIEAYIREIVDYKLNAGEVIQERRRNKIK